MLTRFHCNVLQKGMTQKDSLWKWWCYGLRYVLWQNFQDGNLWNTSSKRRPCEALVGKEDHVMCQQEKKTLWSTRRETRPYRACFLSILSSGMSSVQPHGVNLAILVKRHKNNISAKLFWNQVTGRWGDSFIIFFVLFFSISIELWRPFCSVK